MIPPVSLKFLSWARITKLSTPLWSDLISTIGADYFKNQRYAHWENQWYAHPTNTLCLFGQ